MTAALYSRVIHTLSPLSPQSPCGDCGATDSRHSPVGKYSQWTHCEWSWMVGRGMAQGGAEGHGYPSQRAAEAAARGAGYAIAPVAAEVL